MRLLYLLLLTGMLASGFVKASDDKVTDATKYQDIEITVNVNTASAEELATMLTGVGLKKAQQIVDYRTKNGPFNTLNDLINVQGIGSATLQKNADKIIL